MSVSCFKKQKVDKNGGANQTDQNQARFYSSFCILLGMPYIVVDPEDQKASRSSRTISLAIFLITLGLVSESHLLKFYIYNCGFGDFCAFNSIASFNSSILSPLGYLFSLFVGLLGMGFQFSNEAVAKTPISDNY